jgi:hypothetical protein
MKKQYFLFIIPFYIIAVFYVASTTPISPHEAKIFINSNDLISNLMHIGDQLIGGFLGLRVFFILFGFISLWLFYLLSKRYFTHCQDIYLSVLIFMLLPGILTATTLANVAILVLPLVLLFILLYERNHFLFLPIILLALFYIHEASIIFFSALSLYSYQNKDKKLLILSLTFLISFILFGRGIEIGGRPSGHFIEIFGLYASIFSPFLFLYFFYIMYRIFLREEKTLIWYIAFTAFTFSLILSIRQKVYITDFASYVMIAIIPMLIHFNQSLRVRLPKFQKWYRRGFYAVFGFLLITASFIVFHQFFYILTNKSKKHFAYRIYQPYFLAKKLKEKKLNCYDTSLSRVRYQLQYYDIPPCAK